MKGAFIEAQAGDPVVRATVTTISAVGGIILVIVLAAFHLMNRYLLVCHF
ncbi:MAG: hypothetical protein U1F83_00605 [Verrucomicrobiota bacterium]